MDKFKESQICSSRYVISPNNYTSELNKIQSLLNIVVEQNNTVLEENKKLKEENKKILTHFAQEFVSLKKTVENSITEFKSQKILFSIQPPLELSSVETILQFDEELKEDEEKRLHLIPRFNKQPHDNVTKFIWGNLRMIFKDDDVTKQFSWTNVKGNIDVKDFIFIILLKDLALENIPRTTSSTVDDLVKKILTYPRIELEKLKNAKE